MASVVFYEKPGCINNSRQKAMLEAAGHTVDARDLLTEAWSANRLQQFFQGLPVSDWFNSSAPRVTSAEVVPASLSPAQAIALMLDDPLLIRRPLMQVGAERMVGFDLAAVDAWLGLVVSAPDGDLETCPRTREHAGDEQKSHG